MGVARKAYIKSNVEGISVEVKKRIFRQIFEILLKEIITDDKFYLSKE